MQLNRVSIPRLATPLLIVIGFVLYIIFDNPDPDADLRWPSIVLWVLAGLCAFTYHFVNRKAPKQLLIASTISLAVSIGLLAYAIKFADGFEGLMLFIIGVLPLAGLAALLLLISIYIPIKRPKP